MKHIRHYEFAAPQSISEPQSINKLLRTDVNRKQGNYFPSGFGIRNILGSTGIEIMVLGNHLGQLNIAFGLRRLRRRCFHNSKDRSFCKTSKSFFEARASSWEKAEKAKHMTRLRFRSEEMKFQDCENNHKTKSEAWEKTKDIGAGYPIVLRQNMYSGTSKNNQAKIIEVKACTLADSWIQNKSISFMF